MTETDVSDWKSYEDFSDGIATNRLPSTATLVDTVLEVSFDDGTDVALRFTGTDTLAWSIAGAPGVSEGTGWYEAVELGDETLFVDTRFDELPRESLTVVANTRTRCALAIHSAIDDEKQPGLPRVRQRFTAGVVGPRGSVATESLPAPSRDLVGRRALNRYSANHLYEHVYLSSERYAWQCLEGVERGLADVDPATTYRFDADRYLLAFREYVLDVASVFFLDLREMRSTGKFFGITEDGVVENAPTGAHITLIGPAEYPEGVSPV